MGANTTLVFNQWAHGRLKFDENGRREGASLLIVQWENGVPLNVYPAKDALAPRAWLKR